jgi:hypothetical protein
MRRQSVSVHMRVQRIQSAQKTLLLEASNETCDPGLGFRV